MLNVRSRNISVGTVIFYYYSHWGETESAWWYQPRMINYGDCGAIGGMKIGRRNRSTRRKPVPVPLCPPQIQHDLTRNRIRSSAVGCQRLTTWAMARPGYSDGLRTRWPVFYSRQGKDTLLWFYTPRRPDPVSYAMGTGRCFPEGKASGTWNWPLTSN
jgi:hypothetical protein